MGGQRGVFRKGYAEGILSRVLDHLLREKKHGAFDFVSSSSGNNACIQGVQHRGNYISGIFIANLSADIFLA